MNTPEAHISDFHFGAQESAHVPKAIDALVQTLHMYADRFHAVLPVTINGDLIASPCQRGDANDPRAYRYPRNWEEILVNDARPLFDFLHATQFPVTYLMGNSERRHDMTPQMLNRRFGSNINWTQRTGHHAFNDKANWRLTTHSNLVEPSLPVLKQSALFAEAPRWACPPLGRFLYRQQDQTDAWKDHLEQATLNVGGAAIVENDYLSRFDDEAQIIDDHHKESCLQNEGMDNGLVSRLGLRPLKDRLISETLQSVYLRILATMQLPSMSTRAISFGHIHAPLIYDREALKQRLGVEPTQSLEYIVNTGTGVPLTPAHGGNHLAHAVIWDANGHPTLVQTYDASDPESEPLIVNQAGEKVRRALPRVPVS